MNTQHDTVQTMMESTSHLTSSHFTFLLFFHLSSHCTSPPLTFFSFSHFTSPRIASWVMLKCCGLNRKDGMYVVSADGHWSVREARTTRLRAIQRNWMKGKKEGTDPGGNGVKVRSVAFRTNGSCYPITVNAISNSSSSSSSNCSSSRDR